MRGLNSESVDLIYLDPPFNSNKEYAAPIGSEAAGAAFKDTWTLHDVDRLWLLLLRDKDPTLFHVIEAARLVHGNGMASYLSMMAQRLREMHRVLKPSGSLYLHCDPTASHYLKMLLDAVFGPTQFITDVSWKRSSAHSDARQGRRQHGRIHDVLLFYAKTDDWNWNPVYTEYDREYVENFYRFVEPGTGRKYRKDNLAGPGGAAKGNPQYEVMGVTRYWRYSKERMQELIRQGRVIQTKPGSVPAYKRYLDEMPGVPLQDVWTDIRPIGSQAAERVGYPTQKPLALLDRIIKASSNEGDMVLDPFCGCATACVAAERLGRQWVGIDISEKAAELVQVRIRKEIDLFHNFKPIHRTDQPQRTDLGKLPAPSVHKDLLYGKQSGQCGGCMVMFHKRNLTIDHIVAKENGGTDHIENLWLLCGACNSSKGTKSQAEFLKERVKRGKAIEWLQ